MRVLIAVALLMCGTAAWTAKQEQAHPASGSGAITTGTLPWCKDAKFGELCMTSDGWFRENFPFDLPAKEWDSVTRECCPVGLSDGRPGICWVYPEGGCEDSMKSPVTHHHVSCKDVAPDWKQRVLLDSADGKHHCFAFYLLEQKP